jgi:4-amino-4-deoxy-L-arabinose transferase-like glycosyltransferase
MAGKLDNRLGHWALLVVLWATTCLTGLGGPSLWDIDEGNNATAGREMLASGNWIVPTFNYHVRYDKPVLLYWLQASAYAIFGVSEWAARLPSAMAALLALFVTYELGRGLFGKTVGLLAGALLGTSVAFCASAHFANPDALLNLSTALALWAFWKDHAGGGWHWSLVTGAAAGLGTLAKGPVGLVLPAAVAILFLLWQQEWRQFLHRRAVFIILAFIVVAAPWYVWVATETKGQWVLEFWSRHNVQRMTTPLEGHRGPLFYYMLALIGGLAPWSVFLGPTAWLAGRDARPRAEASIRAAVQFLICWFAVYFVFFSIASTKLPNYILPLYPAIAVLTGRCLDCWRRGEVRLPVWVERTCLMCLAILGVGIAIGALAVSGALPAGVPEHRRIPGLQVGALLGLLWVGGALVAGWYLQRGRRGALIGTVTVLAAVFVASAAGWGAVVVDRCKAPRALVSALPADQLHRDVRIAAWGYFQPSLVFYCGREVNQLKADWQLPELLRGPLPAYAFLPEREWEEIQRRWPSSGRAIARHQDLYDGCTIVVVTNESRR